MSAVSISMQVTPSPATLELAPYEWPSSQMLQGALSARELHVAAPAAGGQARFSAPRAIAIAVGAPYLAAALLGATLVIQYTY